jgi:hypothetical protein
MALASVTAALTQFDASAAWYDSRDTAKLRLEAIEYLLVHRGQRLTDEGSSIDFESLSSQAKDLRAFIGVGAPRAFGRSRRVSASFPATPGVQ